jgi:hypothetical protein
MLLSDETVPSGAGGRLGCALGQTISRERRQALFIKRKFKKGPKNWLELTNGQFSKHCFKLSKIINKLLQLLVI